MANHIIKSAKKLNIEKKIFTIQNIIERSLISSQKYKLYDILGVNELNICMSTLNSIFEETTKLVDIDNLSSFSFKLIETDCGNSSHR